MSAPLHQPDHDDLDDEEQEALDSMVEFDDLLEGDVTTEESLTDPEQR